MEVNPRRRKVVLPAVVKMQTKYKTPVATKVFLRDLLTKQKMEEQYKAVVLILAFAFFYSGAHAQSLLTPVAPQGRVSKFFTVYPVQQSHFLFVKQNAFADMPFFCRMENKNYKRFNILITLRAGSDEAYRKMLMVNGINNR